MSWHRPTDDRDSMADIFGKRSVVVHGCPRGGDLSRHSDCRSLWPAASRRVYGYPHAMQALLVDLLPMTLWQTGNLYAGGRLHFCVGWSDERTVEWQGRQILAGKPGGAARINQRYFQPEQGD